MTKMGIMEEPQTFLYYQNQYPDRESLILFGGCQYVNRDETTADFIKDLKKVFKSLLDSIEQAYLIHFELTETIRGISGELNVNLSNLQQELIENTHDYHAHFGKNRLLRLQMMKQLYQLKQVNAVWFTTNRFPPFQIFFTHWLESILNEFFVMDLLNAIALNVITRLGLTAQAHALLSELKAEISIYIRNDYFRYTI